MAARVIHFGWDDCYRVPVFRTIGLEVWEVESLDDLSFDLQHGERVDAIVVSEDDRETTRLAAAVVRRYSTAPLILFRRFHDGLDESGYDRVFAPMVPPEQWLLQAAEVIAASHAIQEESARLLRECGAMVERSRRLRERSRAERRRNAVLGEPWQFERPELDENFE
jgi:hypothetical protein